MGYSKNRPFIKVDVTGEVDKRFDEVTSQLADKAMLSNPEIAAETRIIGHRGFSAGAPENTLPSYDLAGHMGFWGGENDITTTNDGVWVVMHDSTLDRMTNGTGNVQDHSLAEIKALLIDGGKNIEKYPNLRVPTFEEWLICLKKNALVPVIEMKPGTYTDTDYQSFVDILRKHGMEKKVVLISFDTNILLKVRDISATVYIQPLVNFTSAMLDFCEGLGNAGIDVPLSQVTQDLINDAHSRGISVNAWTVDDSTIAQSYISMGIDFITTNRFLWGNFNG